MDCPNLSVQKVFGRPRRSGGAPVDPHRKARLYRTGTDDLEILGLMGGYCITPAARSWGDVIVPRAHSWRGFMTGWDG